jgi:hypothetical protein
MDNALISLQPIRRFLVAGVKTLSKADEFWPTRFGIPWSAKFWFWLEWRPARDGATLSLIFVSVRLQRRDLCQ